MKKVQSTKGIAKDGKKPEDQKRLQQTKYIATKQQQEKKKMAEVDNNNNKVTSMEAELCSDTALKMDTWNIEIIKEPIPNKLTTDNTNKMAEKDDNNNKITSKKADRYSSTALKIDTCNIETIEVPISDDTITACEMSVTNENNKKITSKKAALCSNTALKVDSWNIETIEEPLSDKPVTEWAGIGKSLGKRLSNLGFDKAYVLLGQFLILKQNRDLFEDWLKDFAGANSKQASDCYKCLSIWCDEYL